MKTSYQLYSSRNFGPLPQTFEMLAKAGYAEVEGYGAIFEGLEDASAIAAPLEESGLTMPSAHFGLAMIEETPAQVIDLAKALGIRHIFVPFIEAAQRPGDAEGWRTFGARVAAACAPLQAAGLGAGWHNHDFEFTALDDGTMPIDAILEGGPDLTLEFDIAWCARAGQDPFSWIEKLAPRIATAHVKDIAAAGKNLNEDGWADVGQGTMDWAGLIAALGQTDCQHFVVEHDNPSDDVRFAAASIAYLNSL